MANTKQTKKRILVSNKQRAANRHRRSTMRTAIKRVLEAVSQKADNMMDVLKKAQSTLDSMVTKGVIHKNKAARHMAVLNNKVKSVSK